MVGDRGKCSVNWSKPDNLIITRESLKSAAISGTLVALFLLVFQPFQIRINSWLIFFALLGFGIVTFLVCILVDLIFKKWVARNFVQRPATLIMIFLYLIFIALGNILYDQVLTGASHKFNFFNILTVFFYTVLVGLVPVSYFSILYYREKQRQVQQELEEQRRAAEAKARSRVVLLRGEGKKDVLKLPSEQLLYLQAQDNYVVVQYLRAGKHRKKLLRASLSKLEKELGKTSLVRCHRSFIVNLDQVANIIGSGGNMHLQLLHAEFAVPVSKKYVQVISEHFVQS